HAFSECCDKGEMRFALLLAQPHGERLGTDGNGGWTDGRDGRAYAHFHEYKLSLPGPNQLEIDVRQKFGVEQRAVLGAMRIINCKAGGKVIEAVWRSRVFAARQQERIKHPLARKEQLAGTLEFGIEKGEIKQRVVRNKRRIADEYNQVLDDFGKERLVFEKLGRQAVDRNGFGRHLPLRIEIAMKPLPGRNAIDELDAADFHHPMALKGIESRGLRIEYDFAHGNVSAMMPAADESLAPLRHCSNRLEDRTHLGARRLEAAR